MGTFATAQRRPANGVDKTIGAPVIGINEENIALLESQLSEYV